MPQENHAELATRCALEMSARVKALQAKWAAAGRAVLEIGIGVNTGEVLVGNIGAEGKKMDYTVIGDHVNLGARVEGLTRQYGAEILITGFTLEKIRDRVAGGALGPILVRGLDRVVVKGKEKPVDIYEVRETEDSAPVVIPCEERAVVHLKEK
jgi:adenylate cyclase